MSELRASQLLFATLLPRLLDEAAVHCMAQHFEFAMGETWRSPEEAKRLHDKGLGILNSLHCDRLAIDLLLRVPDGELLSEKKEYEALGVFWEDLHPRARWGGRFGDPDHFSIEFGGRK